MDVNRDSQQSAEEHRRRSPLMAADQRKVWPRIARMNTQKQSAISIQPNNRQLAIGQTLFTAKVAKKEERKKLFVASRSWRCVEGLNFQANC
jgi:hypothetical protein